MNSIIRIETQTKTIASLLSDIRAGIISVPPFQRDFIWERDNIKDLFDSMSKNYPIGSILMWMPIEKMNWVNKEEIGSFKLQVKTDKNWYVLDGFQRLSALFGCLSNPDTIGLSYDEQLYNTYFKLYYDLKVEEFIYLNSNKHQAYQIPIYVLMSSSDFRQYVRNYMEKNVPDDDINLYLDRADALSNCLLDYRIAYIEIKNANIEEAVDIFSRLNSKGIDISFDWIVNALSYKNGEFKLSDKISFLKKELKEYNFEDLSRNNIFRCIQSAFDKLYIDQTEIEKLAKRQDFIQKTNETIPLIKRAVKFLHDELYVTNSKLLPYNMQLIFIVEFFRKINSPTQQQKDELKIWFWKTTYSNYFTINSLAYQRHAYNHFVDYLKGKANTMFFEDASKLPYATTPLRKRIILNSVRSKAIVLFLNKMTQEDNMLCNTLKDLAKLNIGDYTNFVSLNKNVLKVKEKKFVEGLGLTYIDEDEVSTSSLFNKQYKDQVKSFTSQEMNGKVEFDYKLNDGKFLIGHDIYTFETKWSECGDNSIYCYRDGVKRLGYNSWHSTYPELQEIPTLYDFTSRVKALEKGNIVILENKFGKFAAIKVIEIKRNKNDIGHLIFFEYKIYN